MCTSFWWMEIFNCPFHGLSCTHCQTSLSLGFCHPSELPSIHSGQVTFTSFSLSCQVPLAFPGWAHRTVPLDISGAAEQKGMGELPYSTTLKEENCQGGYSTKARGKQRADGHRLSLPLTPSPCPIAMTSFVTWEK